MNQKIDDVIHKLDALMNGAQPGDMSPPPFIPDTMDAMRAVVKELVTDCRVCRNGYGGASCTSEIRCVNGELFAYSVSMPRWVVKS